MLLRLLVLLLILLPVLTSAQPPWIDFTDPDGAFTVNVPMYPRRDTTVQRWTFGRLTWMVFKINPPSGDLNEHYIVRYADMGNAPVHSDSLHLIQDVAILTQLHLSNPLGADALENLNIKQIRKYPGREFIWTDKINGFGYTTRCFVVKKRLYVLEVKYTIQNDDNYDIDGFLDSFQVLSVLENPNPEPLPERPVKDFEITFPHPPNATRDVIAFHAITGTVFAVLEAYEVPPGQRNDPKLENLGYTISYGILPSQKIHSDSTELVKKMLFDNIKSQGEVLQLKEINLFGYWGLEAIVQSPSYPAVFHFRVVVIENRLYHMAVITVNGKENNAAAVGFLNSFRLKK